VSGVQATFFEIPPLVDPWRVTDKGNQEARALADRHYTRQSPGDPKWTRPGFNFVLIAEDERGRVGAVWVWWRPKWEAGIERKDKLRAIECTIFRNERRNRWLSSDLVRAAVAALDTDAARRELAGIVDPPDGLITGIGVDETRRGRGRKSKPGACYRAAGWVEFEHRGGRADVWLRASKGEANADAA